MTLEEKLQRFPLGVYFPEAGRRHLLTIHSSDEGNQFIVSRTEEGLKRILKGMLTPNAYFDVVGYDIIDLVAPPQWLAEKHALNEYATAVAHFKTNMKLALKEYMKKFPLPDQIGRCPKYTLDPSYFGDGEKPDAWMKKEHYGCLNCKGDDLVWKIPVEDFFDKKRWHSIRFDAFLQVRNNRSRVKRTEQLLPTRAEPADPNKQLWAAIPNHGNHSKGNIFEMIEESAEGIFPGQSFTPLFLCHKQEQKIPAWVDELDRAVKLEREKQRTLDKDKNADRAKLYEQHQFDLVDAVFDHKRAS